MGGRKKAAQQSKVGDEFGSILWRHKSWWLPALVMLLVLVGIVYVMGHLSSADSEMYPTSWLYTTFATRLC